MDLTMGVDITEINNRTNAASSSTVRGVAGRNMANPQRQRLATTIVRACAVETRPSGGGRVARRIEKSVGDRGGEGRRLD